MQTLSTNPIDDDTLATMLEFADDMKRVDNGVCDLYTFTDPRDGQRSLVFGSAGAFSIHIISDL